MAAVAASGFTGPQQTELLEIFDKVIGQRLEKAGTEAAANLDRSQEQLRAAGRVLDERTQESAARQAEIEGAMERISIEKNEMLGVLQQKHGEIEQMQDVMQKFEEEKVGITAELGEKAKQMEVVKAELERAAQGAMDTIRMAYGGLDGKIDTEVSKLTVAIQRAEIQFGEINGRLTTMEQEYRQASSNWRASESKGSGKGKGDSQRAGFEDDRHKLVSVKDLK